MPKGFSITTREKRAGSPAGAISPAPASRSVIVPKLSGGVADNVVAPWAEARLMARLVGASDEVFELLRAWAGAAVRRRPGRVR